MPNFFLHSLPRMFAKPCQRAAICLACLPLIATCVAHGQNSAKNADPAQKTASTGLEAMPLQVESFGLTINLPAGANYLMQKIEGQSVLQVHDDPATPTWTLRIQQLQAKEPDSTAANQIGGLLKDFDAAKQQYQIINNAPFMAGNVAGHYCLIQQSHKNRENIVTGWMLLPTGDQTFLVFTIQTLAEHLSRVRPLIETSFATANVRSINDVAAERAAHLAAGQALLSSFTPEKLKSLAGASQWFRIYKPGKDIQGGETEIGYSLLEVLEAKKGALDPSKNEQNYDKGEKTPGIMVRVQGRVAIDPERKRYYDSIALYWVAFDQSEESWVIRATDRMGSAEQTEAETGVRMGPADRVGLPPTLTVIKSDNHTNTREPHEWEVPEVYMSQPIAWLLGRLMPRDATRPLEYRYYFYNFATRSAQMSLRSDTWTPINEGKVRFKLATKLTSSSEPVISLYDANGELVRRVHPDGSVTEPSTVQAIHRIWKSKNLDVGSQR